VVRAFDVALRLAPGWARAYSRRRSAARSPRRTPPPLAELTADTPARLRAHVFEQSAVLEDVEKDDGVVRIIRLEDKV
jgi:hypothetical protein